MFVDNTCAKVTVLISTQFRLQMFTLLKLNEWMNEYQAILSSLTRFTFPDIFYFFATNFERHILISVPTELYCGYIICSCSIFSCLWYQPCLRRFFSLLPDLHRLLFTHFLLFHSNLVPWPMGSNPKVLSCWIKFTFIEYIFLNAKAIFLITDYCGILSST